MTRCAPALLCLGLLIGCSRSTPATPPVEPSRAGTLTMVATDPAALQQQRPAIIARLARAGIRVESRYGVTAPDATALRRAAVEALGHPRFAVGEDARTKQAYLYLLATEPETLTVETARVTEAPPTVHVGLDPRSAKTMAAYTRTHRGKVVLLMAGDEVLAAPRVREPITGGKVQIAVQGGLAEAERIVGRLKSR